MEACYVAGPWYGKSDQAVECLRYYTFAVGKTIATMSGCIDDVGDASRYVGSSRH